MHLLATKHLDRYAAYVAMTRHRDSLAVHWAMDDVGSRGRLDTVLSRSRVKDFSADYQLDPEAGPLPPAELPRSAALNSELAALAPSHQKAVTEMDLDHHM